MTPALVTSFTFSIRLIPGSSGDGAVAIWGASSKYRASLIDRLFFIALFRNQLPPIPFPLPSINHFPRRSESSSLISLIHLHRVCTAICFMHRRKILAAAAAASPDGEQAAQVQLWDWTSPCVLLSLQSTATLHCVSMSPLDSSMKALGCDGRCCECSCALSMRLYCVAQCVLLRFYLAVHSAFSVWHFNLDADDYGSYGGGQGERRHFSATVSCDSLRVVCVGRFRTFSLH